MDERLNKAGQPSQINWPSLEDNLSGDENLPTSGAPRPPQHLSSSTIVESNSVSNASIEDKSTDRGVTLVSEENTN